MNITSYKNIFVKSYFHMDLILIVTHISFIANVYLMSCCLSPVQALSTDSVERLPVYNKTAKRNYKVSQMADDWCVPTREPLDLAVFRLAK